MHCSPLPRQCLDHSYYWICILYSMPVMFRCQGAVGNCSRRTVPVSILINDVALARTLIYTHRTFVRKSLYEVGIGVYINAQRKNS